MFRRKLALFLSVSLAACIDPYQFSLRDSTSSLVVEAYISDKSYNETLLYPSDGRRFSTRLTLTGDVTNRRSIPVLGAVVELVSSEGHTLEYTATNPGTYMLFDDDFRARESVQYKLRVSLPDKTVFESEWESMPELALASIGQIGFTEIEKQMFIREAGSWVLRTRKAISSNIYVPENNTGRKFFYRWTYSPTWIYVAPLAPATSPYYRCWATDVNYLNTYALQADQAGGYRKELFDILTVRNERIFEKFSVLVTQHAMTEPYYNFWKEMRDQNEGRSLTDVPPYNLKTNFFPINGQNKVIGYFGVTQEQGTRWYFGREDLSYHVDNTLKTDCLVDYGGPPAEECNDCRFYSFGKASAEKPVWWED